MLFFIKQDIGDTMATFTEQPEPKTVQDFLDYI